MFSLELSLVRLSPGQCLGSMVKNLSLCIPLYNITVLKELSDREEKWRVAQIILKEILNKLTPPCFKDAEVRSAREELLDLSVHLESPGDFVATLWHPEALEK